METAKQTEIKRETETTQWLGQRDGDEVFDKEEDGDDSNNGDKERERERQ